jgi:hypothetical protein
MKRDAVTQRSAEEIRSGATIGLKDKTSLRFLLRSQSGFWMTFKTEFDPENRLFTRKNLRLRRRESVFKLGDGD